MIKQYSAGGIVFKKLKTDSRKPKTKWLICQHAQHKGWVFPKGLIGDQVESESREETAVREVQEETGIQAEIIQPLPTAIQYWYHLNGEKYFKTVYYYLMKCNGGNFDDRDDEMMDVRWAEKQEVKETLTYNNDKKAFEEALKIFKK